MSGHSKWNNIKRKKEKADGAKAKIFTKIGRELAVAVKEGGSADPAANSRLRDAIAKAKAANVPNDNIDRIIKKAAGEGSADNYENMTYEGYGPSGVAVIVEALTDNRNRTAADVRHAFDKFGGNLGTTGCVSFMFNKKGVIVIEREGLDEDTVMSDALEAGASDFAADEDVFDTLIEQLMAFDFVQRDPFAPEGEPLLTVAISTDTQQYNARFYEDGETGRNTNIISMQQSSTQYLTTEAWRVGTLLLTCEGTRIFDESGKETPAEK